MATLTKQQLTELAVEAGFTEAYCVKYPLKFRRFAARVAAIEREECAKVCVDMDWSIMREPVVMSIASVECAAAIRSKEDEIPRA